MGVARGPDAKPLRVALKIAFDSQIFIHQAYGGVSRYIYELAQHLNATEDTTVRVYAPLHRNAYFEGLPRAIRGRTYRLPFLRGTTKAVETITSLLSASHIRSFRPDILHQTYYKLGVRAPRGAKRVLTVHDMIFERFPELFQNVGSLRAVKREAIQSSDQIICISRQTQLDLIQFYDVKEERTSVVHHGFEVNIPDLRLPKQAAMFARPYILYVGSRGAQKNFERFVSAYASSPLLRRQYMVVCFGGAPFNRQEELLMANLGLLPECIIQIGGGDSVLANLYMRAELFVYPSLYEGFGIPPLEAMSFGCPVVCSDGGSIPEVVGDAALYFNPFDEEAMRSAIEKVVTSSEVATRLRARGKVRCREYSWAKCASETRAVYTAVLA